MDIHIQDLPFDPSGLRGLSQKLIASHHQNNYSGAVKRVNAIRVHLATTIFSVASGIRLNGLKREDQRHVLTGWRMICSFSDHRIAGPCRFNDNCCQSSNQPTS